MMKLRKNLLIAMIAGLLAFAGVACDDTADDPAEDTGDTGVTDPVDPGAEDDAGLEEDPLEEDPAEEEPAE